jgi:hypothetical protein
MFVETKELVPALRAALESVRYGAKDIRLEAAERVDSYSLKAMRARADL